VRLQLGDATVYWERGLHIEQGEHHVVIDPARPSSANAMLLSNGSLRTVAGLLRALDGVDRPVPVIHPLTDERVPALAAYWSSHFPGPALPLDGIPPDAVLDFGPIDVSAFAVRTEDGQALGYQVQLGASAVVYVPASVPSAAVRGRVGASELAVIRVGTPEGDAARFVASPQDAAMMGGRAIWMIDHNDRPASLPES